MHPVSPRRLRARARDVGRALDRSHVPETFTAILCVGLTLLGLDMLRDPTSYSERATFDVAVGPDGWAQPGLWGVLLVLPCVATLLALAARRRDVYWPLAGVALWLTAWSIAIVLGAANPDAVASAVIAYGTLGAFATLLALVYQREGR